MASTNHNEGDSSESDNGLFQQMEMQNYVTNGGMSQPVVQSNNIKMVTNAQSLPTNVIPQPSPISPSSSQAVLMTGVAIGDQLNKGTTTNTAQITPKMYCIVGYRILLHILLLYAVVISTYLLLTRNDNCQCNQDTQSELNIIDLTTELPTQSPPILESTSSTTTTIEPTLIPSKSPTLLPSPAPSSSPTNIPTSSPTEYYQQFNHFVGDYKISAQSVNHGNWILCDGSFLDNDTYPILFDILGYTFGSFAGDDTIFGLPDATDKVLGVTGMSGSHNIGDNMGSETVTLLETNLPSHYHLLMNSGTCSGYYATTRPYMALQCSVGTGLLANENFEYQSRATTSAPNQMRSSNIGDGTAVNIMQPTMFLGNLFIYADPQ